MQLLPKERAADVEETAALRVWPGALRAMWFTRVNPLPVLSSAVTGQVMATVLQVFPPALPIVGLLPPQFDV